MEQSFIEQTFLPDFSLWDRMKEKSVPLSFEIEVTARCNNNCRHCYINLPAQDATAKAQELSLSAIIDIAEQAVSLGALWCLLTGGEPLLREDFFDLYLALKKRGLLISVFTNACLIQEEHVRFFHRYPPRDLEVTVYGVTEATYNRVTQTHSFPAFLRGLNLLLDGGQKVRLKAMALRSNVDELPAIANFCRERTKDYFRFDPLLHLRFDRDPIKNEGIRLERLTAEEIVAIERADEERADALQKNCHKLIGPQFSHLNCRHLFHCGAGIGNFSVSYDGHFRLCSALWHPDCIYDLRRGNLAEAWFQFIPQVRAMESDDSHFLETCHTCKLVNLCLWCPAHSYLETGRMDSGCKYFCEVAHARVRAIQPPSWSKDQVHL